MPLPSSPVMVVLGGLPGSGKSSIAGLLAGTLGATWLRVDLLEQAMRDCDLSPGPAGYVAAQALAAGNLAVGNAVVADAVNAVPEARAGWRAAAARAGARLLEVHIRCSDPAEHRHRVESRNGEIPGLVLPDWATVQAREFQPWPEARVLETAGRSVQQAAATLAGWVGDLSETLDNLPAPRMMRAHFPEGPSP